MYIAQVGAVECRVMFVFEARSALNLTFVVTNVAFVDSSGIMLQLRNSGSPLRPHLGLASYSLGGGQQKVTNRQGCCPMGSLRRKRRSQRQE